jgi:hypothetical protein
MQAFIESCTPLAIIDSLEAEMQARVDAITSALIGYTVSDDPLESLSRFLAADADFLGVALALTNISQEKFLRILSAERFSRGDFGNEWGIDRIHRMLQQDSTFANLVARLLLEGRSNPLLAQQVAPFYLNQLSLAENWQTLIQDAAIMQKAVRHKLEGEYSDKKGDAIEQLIRTQLDGLREKYGIAHSKGQVALVDKEVDHIVPSIDEPYVMIMTSYMETTSSSQTIRANEQSEMYGKVQSKNRRYGKSYAFVNFVDGAGWLARRSDLRKLYEGCDYIINLKTLDMLEAIICKVVPAAFFTKRERPRVIES